MKYITRLVNGMIVEYSQVGITRRVARMRDVVSTREFFAVSSVYPAGLPISKKTAISYQNHILKIWKVTVT